MGVIFESADLSALSPRTKDVVRVVDSREQRECR